MKTNKEQEQLKIPIRRITNSGFPKMRENPPIEDIYRSLEKEEKPKVVVEKSPIDRVSMIKELNLNKYKNRKK